VVTSEAGWRTGVARTLKDEVDEALVDQTGVRNVIVVRSRRSRAASCGGEGDSAGSVMTPGRDLWWHEGMAAQESEPVVPCLPGDARGHTRADLDIVRRLEMAQHSIKYRHVEGVEKLVLPPREGRLSKILMVGPGAAAVAVSQARSQKIELRADIRRERCGQFGE